MFQKFGSYIPQGSSSECLHHGHVVYLMTIRKFQKRDITCISLKVFRFGLASAKQSLFSLSLSLSSSHTDSVKIKSTKVFCIIKRKYICF